MKITSLKVANFLGAKSANVTFGNLTMLYGANGSSKTSLMDALRFALDGEAVRGYTLSGLVYGGAKTADVEVNFTNGTDQQHRVGRLLAASGQSRFLDGAELKAEEMAAELAKLTGCGAKTMNAALRAGALLKLPPADLQKLLLRLTGAKLDAAAVAAAFEESVTTAAKRAELHLPAALEEFAQCCKAAESVRQEAKRSVKAAEADVSHLPPAGPVAPQGADRAALVAARATAQAAHTRAVAANVGDQGQASGAREERLRGLRARQTELRAIEKPKGTIEEAHTQYKAATAMSLDLAGQRERVKAALAIATHNLDAARKVAKPYPGEAPVIEDPTPIRVELTAAQVVLGGLEKTGKDAKERLDSANVAGCSHGCTVHCVDIEKETGCYNAAKAAFVKQRKVVKELTAKLKAAEDAASDKADVVAGIQAAARVAELEPEVARLKAELQSIPDTTEDIEKCKKRVDAHEAFATAEVKLRQVAAEIEAVMAQPDVKTVDTEPLRIAANAAIAAVEEFDRAQVRTAAEGRLAAARQRVEDSDAVAVACGPKGSARVRLFATAMAPFVAAANEAIAIVMPEFEMVLEADGELAFAMSKAGLGRFPYTAISEGEAAVFEYALQYAVATLAGLGLLILDHAENVDEGRRLAMKRLIGTALKQNWQVVLLSCTKPPEKAPKGCSCYRVVDGVVSEIAP